MVCKPLGDLQKTLSKIFHKVLNLISTENNLMFKSYMLL